MFRSIIVTVNERVNIKRLIKTYRIPIMKLPINAFTLKPFASWFEMKSNRQLLPLIVSLFIISTVFVFVSFKLNSLIVLIRTCLYFSLRKCSSWKCASICRNRLSLSEIRWLEFKMTRFNTWSRDCLCLNVLQLSSMPQKKHKRKLKEINIYFLTFLIFVIKNA